MCIIPVYVPFLKNCLHLPCSNKQMYSRNEVRALHLIFSYHAEEIDESDGPLFIYPSQCFDIIQKLCRNEKELLRMKKALMYFQEQQQLQRRDPSSSTAVYGVEAPSDSSTIESNQATINDRNAVEIVTEVPIGCIAFDAFASIIVAGRQARTEDTEAGEYHMHFLGTVFQYQNRCDSEGKYLLAKEFMDQISVLQKEEENRVVKKVKDMLMVDRAKIVAAHEKQLIEFTQSE